jgi:hypothetical protein
MTIVSQLKFERRRDQNPVLSYASRHGFALFRSGVQKRKKLFLLLKIAGFLISSQEEWSE